MTPIDIAGHKIGPGYPCFIIAEAGVNHNGDVELARRLVDVAAEAGAAAIKFQTFKSERVVSAGAPKAKYQIDTTDPTESQLDMIRELELSPDEFRQIQAYCYQRGVLFMSTPFDHESVDLLADMDVPAFKIGSGEITNLPLLAHVAGKGKPIIVSTGMSTMDDVANAMKIVNDAGADKPALLHCVSNYPADPADANLRAMHALAVAFDVPVGYSDHTQGMEVMLAAVALGAHVVEKHFTLDRSMPGPDHLSSLEPDELSKMVRSIRIVESSLGHGRKEPAASEANTAAVARRSLVAASHISAGTRLTHELIEILRPGTGFAPELHDQIVGKLATTDIPKGTLLSWEMLD
jgi:N,N'-diacetyllegionaminate synthase